MPHKEDLKFELKQLKYMLADLKATPEAQSQEMEEETFTVQPKDTQSKLVATMEESKNMERSAEQLEEELLQVKEKLDNAMLLYEQAQQKSGSQEVEIQYMTNASNTCSLLLCISLSFWTGIFTVKLCAKILVFIHKSQIDW